MATLYEGILQGISSLGVCWQEKIWLDMTSSFQVRIYTYFVKVCRTPLLSLSELKEKLRATIIFGKFVNK